MVFAIISSLSITSQLLLALAGARTSVTSWVTYISALEWKTNQQKSNIFCEPLKYVFPWQFSYSIRILLTLHINHIIFSVEISKTRIREKCHLIFLFKFLKYDVRCWVRSRICVKYLLSFPQKNLRPEKTENAKCLLFNFLMITFTVI